MEFFDQLTAQRIDSATADAVDELLARALPGLKPCAVPLGTVLAQLPYPKRELPPEHRLYAQTALSVVETCYPEECEWLPDSPEERGAAALALKKALHLELHCLEISNEAAARALYARQREELEAHGASPDAKWTPRPIRICAEATSGYCLVTGSERLREEIIAARGVTAEDIAERSAALIAYLRAKDAVGR